MSALARDRYSELNEAVFATHEVRRPRAANSMRSAGTPLENQHGFGSGTLVRFLLIVVVIFMLPSLLSQCAQRAPGVVASLGGQVGNQIADEITGLWENTDDADKVRAFCEAMPVDGVDDLCEYFAAPVAAATDMRRERIACLWQAAYTSQGIDGIANVLQIQNTCAAYRRDPSGLETCLQGQVASGPAAQCLAMAPGQFWRSRGMLQPLACPDNVPGVQCDSEQQPQQPQPYQRHEAYLTCLYNTAYQYNGDVDTRGCAQFNQPQDIQRWDQCMVNAITNGFQRAAAGTGASLVRACENLKPKWWQFWLWGR